ncbi:MAG: PHB depolymerase family esterase [Pseudomonadota bacterium]
MIGLKQIATGTAQLDAGCDALRRLVGSVLPNSRFGVVSALKFLVAFGSSLAFSSLGAEMTSVSLFQNDVSRSFVYYAPEHADSGTPLPLVIALHGRGGNGTRMAKQTEFNRRAESMGFVVAYPDAVDGVWLYPRGIGGFPDTPDDSAFVLSVIDQISEQVSIDGNRIGITGLSNGGFMAQRIACDYPDRFRGVVSVGAPGFAGMSSVCEHGAAIPILFIHGTDDLVVPWHGRAFTHDDGSRELVTLSVSASVKLWSERNGCGSEVSRVPRPRKGDSPETLVIEFVSSDCRDGGRVGLLQVVGGGHNWPGVEGIIPKSIAGRTNLDIHASDEVLRFLELLPGQASE